MATPVAAPGENASDESRDVDLNRLRAVFQPQLSSDTGEVTGVEALARLDHPVRGLLGPAEFLALLNPAQQRRLTRMMLTQAMAALRHWDALGTPVPRVSLNVSAADLTSPDFAEIVLWELDRMDVPPARLVLEVVEDLSPLDMPDRVRRNLDRLADAGCGIDLDDFGTGYSSLDALRRLRVGRVKIDRCFISGCDHDTGQQRMILAVLALADRLGLQAVAEGVETAAEHAFVAQIGCSHVQGFAIARPMPVSDMDGFLAERRAAAKRLPVIRRA